MEIRLARRDDIGTYADLGRKAQEWLKSRGLRQYVPAAHDECAAAISARIESGTLYAVSSDGVASAFFSLDPFPSRWWPEDGASALYIAGMVVAREARGRGIGGVIIRWCVGSAERLGRQFVRLECHADNRWLCGYYESHGFMLEAWVEQYPGYTGCLYQRPVSLTTEAQRRGES